MVITTYTYDLLAKSVGQERKAPNYDAIRVFDCHLDVSIIFKRRTGGYNHTRSICNRQKKRV